MKLASTPTVYGEYSANVAISVILINYFLLMLPLQKHIVLRFLKLRVSVNYEYSEMSSSF